MEIHTVGIIGEGKMGTSIFHCLPGIVPQLRWLVSSAADRENIMKSLEKRIRREVNAGVISESEAAGMMNGITVGTGPELLDQCDLVIEAIPEDLDLKNELLRNIDPHLLPECLIATNSSSILPSALAPSDKRKPFLLGMHFFYPVMMKETVELIVTPDNPAEVVSKAICFLERLRKKPLLQNEQQAFLLNRMWLDIQNEAFLITESGAISIPEMDALVRQRLFSFGVFDFIDSVGIDVMARAISNYIAGYPNGEFYRSLLSRLERMVQSGELGRKSGKGFYAYPMESALPYVTGKFGDIEIYLKNIYLNTARRYTMISKLSVGDMNDAIREYFGLEKGPFELS